MLFDIDRLNRLRQHFGLRQLDVSKDIFGSETRGTRHDVGIGFTPWLNDVDQRAGINTRGAQVGARLARLERRVFSRPEPVPNHMFWLGADGENPDRGRADTMMPPPYRGCG